MARPKDSEDEWCPSTSVCPAKCQWDETMCPGGTDSRGCKNADNCLPRGEDVDGNLCHVECPVKCKNTELFCQGPIKRNGCKDVDVCVEKGIDTNDNPCLGVCPVHCDQDQVETPGGMDARGCQLPATCIVPKKFGKWANQGQCVPTVTDKPTTPIPFPMRIAADPLAPTSIPKACGPGTQLQHRTCTDGTTDKCTEDDVQRSITCSAAGVPLPPCEDSTAPTTPTSNTTEGISNTIQLDFLLFRDVF